MSAAGGRRLLIAIAASDVLDFLRGQRHVALERQPSFACARGREPFPSREKFGETALAHFNGQLSGVLRIARNPPSGGNFRGTCWRIRVIQTAWRMTQSAANKSLLKQFPDKQGNNREFPHFQPSPDLSSSEKATDHRRFFGEFPRQENRES